MARTQEEILERFLGVRDVFGTQQSDLSNFLEFDHVKHLLTKETLELGKDKWVLHTDPIKDILDYLPFAYDKARNQRGLSSARSLLHMRSWIWLTGDEEFYQEFESITTETARKDRPDFGISILDRISEKYGYVEA